LIEINKNEMKKCKIVFNKIKEKIKSKDLEKYFN